MEGGVVLRGGVGLEGGVGLKGDVGVGFRRIPRKQSASLKTRVGWSWADCLMYVAHFGVFRVGRNRSNPVIGGGSLFALSHGSCRRRMRYWGD